MARQRRRDYLGNSGRGIASYTERIVILTGAKADPDTFGERVESHSPTVAYWARREQMRAGESALFNAVRQTTETIMLAIQGRPPVTSQDRIRFKATGEEFGVDSTHFDRAENETILTCTKPG